ncbi:pentapeptide repeat-containing protein [Angustibacter aerolatus]
MPDVRQELRADCARCAGLCCVAPAFTASADFAIDKPAGRPCPNLLADSRCGIHDVLPQRGFRGCVTFDCLGAGQATVQRTFGGRDWRESPELARSVFAAFGVLRGLHELRWYLVDALAAPGAAAVHDDLAAELERLESLCDRRPEELTAIDSVAEQQRVAPLLARATSLVHGRRPGPDLRGADLAGRDLRRTTLRRAVLRGALLLGAALLGVDLEGADLVGADLRGADLRGADLRHALFLNPMQLAAARTDATTRPPGWADVSGR